MYENATIPDQHDPREMRIIWLTEAMEASTEAEIQEAWEEVKQRRLEREPAATQQGDFKGF